MQVRASRHLGKHRRPCSLQWAKDLEPKSVLFQAPDSPQIQHSNQSTDCFRPSLDLRPKLDLDQRPDLHRLTHHTWPLPHAQLLWNPLSCFVLTALLKFFVYEIVVELCASCLTDAWGFISSTAVDARAALSKTTPRITSNIFEISWEPDKHKAILAHFRCLKNMSNKSFLS